MTSTSVWSICSTSSGKSGRKVETPMGPSFSRALLTLPVFESPAARQGPLPVAVRSGNLGQVLSVQKVDVQPPESALPAWAVPPSSRSFDYTSVELPAPDKDARWSPGPSSKEEGTRFAAAAYNDGASRRGRSDSPGAGAKRFRHVSPGRFRLFGEVPDNGLPFQSAPPVSL